MILIRARDVPAVQVPEDDLVMLKLLRAETTPSLSVTYVRLQGRHRPLRTNRSTRVYYVLEGAAEFSADGEPAVVAAAGDLVVIPPGQRYSLAGDLSYLVMNAPAYVEGDDIYDDAGP